jgi:hypothetical protein
MAKINLSGMSVEALMDLRKRVDEALNERRAELEKQLERMAVIGGRRVVRGGRSAFIGQAGGKGVEGRELDRQVASAEGDDWATASRG